MSSWRRRHLRPNSSPIIQSAESARRVRVEGQVTFNDSRAMIDAAGRGFGIAYVPEDMVTQHVRSGELVTVLDDWPPKLDGYYIYYPTSRQNSAAFKVIVDALRYHDERRKRG
jgi:DNA-binding transcriptional LysR family regulator